MRIYKLLLLRFTAPVHFGTGGGLESGQSFCRADTFFSALCWEAADMDSEILKTLVEKSKNGDIRIADLLPWYKRRESYELYIPRPLLILETETREERKPFHEVKAESQERKKRKKRSYIRASELGNYIADAKSGRNTLSEQPLFGQIAEETKYNSRTAKPYTVGNYYFSDQAGLYVLVSLADGEDWDWLEPLILSVGHGGIGGRRSSGNGTFQAEDDVVELSEYEVYGKDDAALYTLLENKTAKKQMCLAPCLPQKEEVPIAVAGTGKLVKRSGFAYSRQMAGPVKMNTVYMMTTGSCFTERMEGRIADVNNGSAPHPIYKYGKGFFIGVEE